MRVYIDACIDPRVAEAFADQYVRTALQLGYLGAKDNELIQLLQDQFDALITIDQGFEFQHNLRALRFGIIIVHVIKNKVEFYRPVFPELRAAAQQILPGEIIHVRAM